jgi:hypothetical protein
MKVDRSIFTVLLLVTAAVFQLPAQQNEADRRVLAEIRAEADKGNDDATHNMTIVENKMTREQIAEAQRLARDFKPRKMRSEGSDARLPP